MDKYSLYSLMEANSLSSEDLLAHYSFSGSSGMLIFNEAQESSGTNWMSGHFLDWPSTGQLDFSLYPGLSIGKNDIQNSSSDNDGSGYFTGDSVVEVGSGAPTEWTTFVSFSGGYLEDRKDVSRVILSTADSPNANSGFFVGENSRSLFVENYNTDDSVSDITTLNKESLNKNLMSISKDAYGTVSVGLHDLSDGNDFYSETFLLDGYTDSEQIYLGGFKSNQDLSYTGFSGYIDDFVVISGSLGEFEKIDIATAFFASNYTRGGYTQTSAQFAATSGMVLKTGVIDSGITGYENALVGTVTNAHGESVSVYISSGVTGEITGEFYSGVTGSGVSTVLTTSITEDSLSYDSNVIKSYAPETVVFKNKLLASDIYEIYSQKNKSDSMNLKGEFNQNEEMFYTSLDFTGIESNNEIALIYANGILLSSGTTNTGMYVRDGEYMIDASGYFSDDLLIYDRIQTYSEGQVDYEVVGQQGFVNFVNAADKYLEKDIYHEGVKLLSGEHWSSDGTDVDITDIFGGGGYISPGTLSFVPVVKDGFERATGLGAIAKVTPGFKMINEQVWVNGMRQRRNVDYFPMDNASPLASDNREAPGSYMIYSGETGLYNV